MVSCQVSLTPANRVLNLVTLLLDHLVRLARGAREASQRRAHHAGIGPRGALSAGAVPVRGARPHGAPAVGAEVALAALTPRRVPVVIPVALAAGVLGGGARPLQVRVRRAPDRAGAAAALRVPREVRKARCGSVALGYRIHSSKTSSTVLDFWTR